MLNNLPLMIVSLLLNRDTAAGKKFVHQVEERIEQATDVFPYGDNLDYSDRMDVDDNFGVETVEYIEEIDNARNEERIKQMTGYDDI